MARRDYTVAIAAAGALFIHGLFAGGLVLADRWMIIPPPPLQQIELEVQRQPPPPPPPKVEEKEPEPPPAAEAPKTPPPPRRAARMMPPTAEPPPPSDDPPPAAPVEVTADPAPYRMDDLGGTVEVPRGEGTGIGNPHGRKGATGPPAQAVGVPGGTGRTVSVASVKRQPRVLGDADYLNLGKAYPKSACEQRRDGLVVVSMVVGIDGRPSQMKIVRGIGYGLDEKALELARDFRFEPAVDTNDEKVATRISWNFEFRLPEGCE